MTVSRARLAKLEAAHDSRRGCLTVREVEGSDPVELVATGLGSNGERWTQRPRETFGALVHRIEADARVATLVVCTDREIPGATKLRRSYGTTIRRFSEAQFHADLFGNQREPAVPLPSAAHE